MKKSTKKLEPPCELFYVFVWSTRFPDLFMNDRAPCMVYRTKREAIAAMKDARSATHNLKSRVIRFFHAEMPKP